MLNHGQERYMPKLNLCETQRAIRFLKLSFENHLSGTLNLLRVSAPVMVQEGSGVQETVRGLAQGGRINVKGIGGKKYEIV